MGKASRRERGTKRADTQAAVQTDVVAVGGAEHDRQYNFEFYALDWCSALRRLCCTLLPYPDFIIRVGYGKLYAE